ncbi:MAG: hypothetical protein EOM50_01755 [Erysipelotrichia bacterium]|nr:hypothetical protein [Erysipelotrichia bacterium]
MSKIFEDAFMDLQSEFVSLSLELVEKKANIIYIYISIEEKSKMFNIFVKSNEEIKTINLLGLDRALVMQFLKMGTNDIDKIKDLCNEYSMKVPTEMKMIYHVQTGKYNVDLKYESVCSSKTGISSGEVFAQWINETKKGV